MKTRTFINYLSLLSLLVTCSKENSDEFDLLQTRNNIISKIKSDNYDSYLKAFVDDIS